MGIIRTSACLLVLAWTVPANADPPAEQEEPKHRIAGTVMEVRAGTPDVVVFVCDQRTGIPLSAETRRPFTASGPAQGLPKLLTSVTDDRGQFAFEDLPEGEYRVVAQKWAGPFKGVFEVHGTVIQLFGWADHIRVPSTEAERVVLTPKGDGVLHLDQDVGNNETLLLLSTEPPAADPILGFVGLGDGFLTHMIGVNRMPYGRTTVLGLPPGTVHAFFFAPDNSPGFAAGRFEVDGLRARRAPFVAGWSDAQHDPPPRIREVMDLMRRHNLHADRLLGIDPSLPPQRLQEERLKLAKDLNRKVELPEGQAATVGEILAAEGYASLQEAIKQRQKPR